MWDGSIYFEANIVWRRTKNDQSRRGGRLSFKIAWLCALIWEFEILDSYAVSDFAYSEFTKTLSENELVNRMKWFFQTWWELAKRMKWFFQTWGPTSGNYMYFVSIVNSCVCSFLACLDSLWSQMPDCFEATVWMRWQDVHKWLRIPKIQMQVWLETAKYIRLWSLRYWYLDWVIKLYKPCPEIRSGGWWHLKLMVSN